MVPYSRRVALPQPGSIYKRLAGDGYVRGLDGFRGRRLVKGRSLLPRRLQPRVTVTAGDVRLVLTPDPVDAEIADSVVNRHRHVYFPDAVDRPADVRLVLEVGGHHGIYTAVAASVYPNARIITLEPSLDAIEVLREQLRLNRLEARVDVVPAAIGRAAGIATLSHDPSGSWGATLFSPDDVTRTEVVVTLPLASVVREVPDVVKSNAEGAEFELVPQLEELSERPRVLVLAVHPEFGDIDVLRERLTAMGYVVSEAVADHHPVWHCVLSEAATQISPRSPEPG